MRLINSRNTYHYSLQILLSSHLLSKTLKTRVPRGEDTVLNFVLNGCGALSHTLKEERKLQLLQNKILMKIFGSKKHVKIYHRIFFRY
jgi:hypothetical protein